jgi:chromosome segregation ATPase
VALTTKDSSLNQGGRAQLYLEDRLNPFERQIHYTPQPPGKRAIHDVTQLSGGEKTVAALALVFALIQVKRPPLLLMDEVDAFLDTENVSLVTQFMKSQLKAQTVMVSHKEVVIKEAQSLIGCSFVKA